MRLDNYLVEKDLAQSRNKAQEMIKNSLVSINEKIVTKPSFKVCVNDSVSIKEHKSYVSRAAFKLLYFLEEIALDVKEKIALDIGSSTGGFTQVLLERGVKEVSCVDVGRDQLHKTIREDGRVLVFENCDIRKFQTQQKFDIVVSDVSFISLEKILDDVHRLASQDIILLFKPQFEVGREVKRDSKGVVVDKRAIERAMQRFEDAALLLGWELMVKSPSKLTGKDGNLEYCYYFQTKE